MPVQESKPDGDPLSDAPAIIAEMTGNSPEEYTYTGEIKDITEMEPTAIDEWEAQQTDQ